MCFHTTIQLWNHKLITFLAISISVGVGDFLCRVERPSILGRVERPSILGGVERPSILGKAQMACDSDSNNQLPTHSF